MDINLLFKIAAIGILVAVLHQVLVRAGREDQAMMTTLARFSYSFNNGNKRNKHFVWNSKNNIQFIKIAEGMKINLEVIRIIGIGLIALIIIILLKQYRPEFAIYISLLTGVLILLLVMDKLTGIINLLQTLANKTSINSTFLTLLIKITGIAFLSEFAVSICKDSGEAAIASKIEIGTKIIIISMSIPIISSLLEIILKILP